MNWKVVIWKFMQPAFQKIVRSGAELEWGELLLLRASVHIRAWGGAGGFRVAHLLPALGKAKGDHYCYSPSQCTRPLPHCQVGINMCLTKSCLAGLSKTFCTTSLLFQGVIQAAWTCAKAFTWLLPALLGLPRLARGESRSISWNIIDCCSVLSALD